MRAGIVPARHPNTGRTITMTSLSEQRDNMAKWIAALESGIYRKGREALVTEPALESGIYQKGLEALVCERQYNDLEQRIEKPIRAYCCLGVLCMIDDSMEEWPWRFVSENGVPFDSYIPDSLAEKYGIDFVDIDFVDIDEGNKDAETETKQEYLAWLNDQTEAFDERVIPALRQALKAIDDKIAAQ